MIKRILYATVGLMLAVGLGLMMQKDSGYVLLQYNKTTIEMSFWLFAFSTLVLLILLSIIFHYWLKLQLIFRMRRVRQQRDNAIKHSQQVEHFLSNYAFGKYQKARRSIPKLNESLRNWWQGHLALKLEEQPAITNDNNLLSHQIALEVALQNGELPQTLPLELPEHLLMQAFELATHTHQFAVAQQALEQLPNWLTKDELNNLEAIFVASKIDHLVMIGEFEIALREFDSLPKSMKRIAAIVLPIAKLYHYQGLDDLARQAIEVVLKHENNSQLIELYGKLAANNLDKMFKQAERWHKQYPNDPYIHILLGILSEEMGLSSQAQSYFESSIALQPTHSAYAALALLFEKQDNSEMALKAYKEGCLLTKKTI